MQTQVTNTVAVGGLSSPLWLDYFQSVSHWAAILMPILGALWLATQLFITWNKYLGDRNDK